MGQCLEALTAMSKAVESVRLTNRIDIYIGRRFFDGQRREAIEGNRTRGELLQKRWRQVSQHRSVDDSIDDYLYKEACDFYYIRHLPYKEGVNMTLV